MTHPVQPAQEPNHTSPPAPDRSIHLAGTDDQASSEAYSRSQQLPEAGSYTAAGLSASVMAQTGEYHRPLLVPNLDREGLIAALTDLLSAGAALRRSRLASWAIAQREADLQRHISAIVQELVDWDDQHDAGLHEHAPAKPHPRIAATAPSVDTVPLRRLTIPSTRPSTSPGTTTGTDVPYSGQNRVSTSSFVLTDEGAFLCLRWNDGLLLRDAHIKASISAVNTLSISGRMPLIVHLGAIAGITYAARELILADTCSTRTAILGVDLVGEVISGFSYGSLTPTRYFTDENLARHWLLHD